MRYDSESVNEAFRALRGSESDPGILKPGDTVYTVLRHVSRSGMRRAISLVVPSLTDEGRPYIADLDYWAARVLGMRIDPKHGGIVIDGCGMDLGFQLVYLLGRKLWPDGTRVPHGTRNGAPDSDGGYAIKREWL